MPRCHACGKSNDNPDAFELVRREDNRWLSICRSCLNGQVDVNQIEPVNIVIEPEVMASADSPGIAIAPSTKPLDDIKRLLDALRGLRQTNEHMGRARTHERKQIELVVDFTLARDDTRHQATVKDYSQGGIRILCRLALTKGQVVRFDWDIPLPPAMARMLQNTAEARRVTRTEGGMYDVGLKFTSRQSDKGANRRRFRRYKCDMVAYYQRDGSEMRSSARVKDISQGGCQIRLDEELKPGEAFTVRFIGGGGAKGDLVGTMRACRVMKKEAGYETGCAFEQMRMEKQAATP